MTDRTAATPMLVAGYACACFRCGHTWVSVCKCGVARDDLAQIHRRRCKPPAACARCSSAAWSYPLDPEGPGRRAAKKPGRRAARE
jgi:hypothetical protein